MHIIWRHVETCRFPKSFPTNPRKQIPQKTVVVFAWNARLFSFLIIPLSPLATDILSFLQRSTFPLFCLWSYLS